MTLKYYMAVYVQYHSTLHSAVKTLTTHSAGVWHFWEKKNLKVTFRYSISPFSQTTPGGTTGEHTALGDKLYFLHQNIFF